MPRPPPIRYREAISALETTHRTLMRIIQTVTRMQEARAELRLLTDTLGRLLARDDGRSR